jgi:hypothetical protein
MAGKSSDCCFESFDQQRQFGSGNSSADTGEILVLSVDGKGVVMRQQDLRGATQRDPHREKSWVALVDGNKHQLRLLRKYARQHHRQLTIVLDLVHVMEYLWSAAFVFHPVGSQSAEDWLSQRLLKILQGQASRVAAGMRRSATRRGYPPDQRAPVDTCANYLLKYQSFLHYDRYLAAGFPIRLLLA